MFYFLFYRKNVCTKPSNDLCCWTTKCCGRLPYNPFGKACCGGKVLSTQGMSSLACCGNSVYDRSKKVLKDLMHNRYCMTILILKCFCG